MITLKKIIEKINYLPPFPLTVTKVLQMLKDPKVTPENIAMLVAGNLEVNDHERFIDILFPDD